MPYQIEKKYELAKTYYSYYGVSIDSVLEKLKNIPISIHCWQGDDLTGFENLEGNLYKGGILVTGNYQGRARNIDELQLDINKAFSLIPGKKKLSLHAIYGNFKKRVVDRNEISPEDFLYWIDWAKEKSIGIDFNPTFFSHPYA
jgi:L-rhamnose isomerase